MKQHVNRIAAICFFHLRRLRQIRRRIGRNLMVRLLLAFITARLDYCNSVLAGLPQITLSPLQRVQNAAARLVFELRGCDHVTPSLIQLHWLPVRWRIYFKLCTIMHAVHTGRCPAAGVPAAQQHVLDYARQCQPTTSFHDYVRSSANESSMPVHSRGILFQYTSEKRWTFIVLKDFSRLILLV